MRKRHFRGDFFYNCYPLLYKQEKLSKKKWKIKFQPFFFIISILVRNDFPNLHYFSFEFLTINFCFHHISTPSKPLILDFFKIVDFQKERNFLNWWWNSVLFEKTWLLQESITHSKTVFAAIVSKNVTFKCFIIDVGNTIFF